MALDSDRQFVGKPEASAKKMKERKENHQETKKGEGIKTET